MKLAGTLRSPNLQRKIGWPLTLLFLLLAFETGNGFNAARAQVARSMPAAEYFTPFPEFYRGNYRVAANAFRRLESSAYKFGTLRFLDSVCYWTMLGECNFHAGNYAEAIRFYEQGLELYLVYCQNNWQNRIQGNNPIQADNNALNRARINWGTSGRTALIPRMPNSFGVLFGQLDAELRLQEGGVLQNPEVRQVDLTEILRCVALSIQRRNQILGPTSKVSTFSNRLAAGLRVALRSDGSLFGAYNSVLLGLAQSSAEDWNSAKQSLQSGLQFNNGFDHPLTGIALLELSQIGIATEDYDSAFRYALEASYSGAFFNQYDVVEEGILTAARLYMFQGKGVLPALAPVIEWARLERAHRMQASLAICLAESFVEAGMMPEAATALAMTNQPSARFALTLPALIGRSRYVQAQADFQSGNFANGLTQLNASLTAYRPCSLWLYRLAMAEVLVTGGVVTERQADVLYSSLLRDPNSRDWRMEPIEALTFLASDHLSALERWFEVVNNRKDLDRALEIADMARRHRFFASLPMGGRLISFRWMMHGPVECLSAEAREQRRAMFVRYPEYQLWTDRIEQIRTSLSLLPKTLDPAADEFRQQLQLLTEMEQISLKQDSFLARNALSRLPVDMVFPPQIRVSNLRLEMRPDQLALVSFATFNGIHLFLVNSNMTQYLGLASQRDLQRQIPAVLKAIGASEAFIDVASLQSDSWKKTAEQATQALLGEISADDWSRYKELLVVPDGVLWYFPFEIIQAKRGDVSLNLVDLVEIRYSPTLSLGYIEQRPYRMIRSTGVGLSKVHLKGDSQMAKDAFETLTTELPEAVKFESIHKNVSPRLLTTLYDQFILWEEITLNRSGNPFDLAPLAMGPAEPTPFRNWFRLPLTGPEHIILSSFHSDAGTGLKGKRAGTDLFLTSVALMGSGSRSVLISRWRTGGANSLELTSQYARKIPNLPTGQAFRESLSVAREQELKFDLEPQVRSKKGDPTLRAEHPYFWAGWMRFEIPATNSPWNLPDNELVDAEDPPQADQDQQRNDAANQQQDQKMQEQQAQDQSKLQENQSIPTQEKKSGTTQDGKTDQPEKKDPPENDKMNSKGDTTGQPNKDTTGGQSQF
jgi:tetratricopeptide (TPR) repeat protein